MQEMFGSVRRSLVFRPPPEVHEDSAPSSSSLSPIPNFVEKINSCIRKSRVFSKPSPPPTPPPIRWRKGELIGCGAFGRVYMGMNLDSGELLAVKQVLIATNTASKEKAQAHIMELEEEVKLLKNLYHSNIVRYLGTVREEENLNILLEFVPGGSISSLLGKFGPFPETVIRTYTKQLLLGLEYLHKNGIMHRDIKGANILVDNKGCIKLADFGASKQVVELATISCAKSMKGTPYWMAPEVILQTGHSFSADIWSVGCTVIEMATGKPPWSQQFQEVAALFHIGTTKSHPPIPDNISAEAKDFLLKCLQKEPNLRPTASELLQMTRISHPTFNKFADYMQHPFVTGENMESHSLFHSPAMEKTESPSPSHTKSPETINMSLCSSTNDICNLYSLQRSNGSPGVCNWKGNGSDDDMCLVDDKDDFTVRENLNSSSISNQFKSFNPISEPDDDWACKFGQSPGKSYKEINLETAQQIHFPTELHPHVDKEFSFPCGRSLSEDDDELTESKIKVFLDEKALELKKLQSPLYEEFYNSLNVASTPSYIESAGVEASPKFLKLPPKSRSPSRGPVGPTSDAVSNGSPGSHDRRASNICPASDHISKDTPSPPRNDWKGHVVDGQQESNTPSPSYSERQRKWKEELDQELERKREMMRQAGSGGKTSSPIDRALIRPRERTRFASPGS